MVLLTTPTPMSSFELCIPQGFTSLSIIGCRTAFPKVLGAFGAGVQGLVVLKDLGGRKIHIAAT